MTRRFFGFLGALAGLALVGGSCVTDPLSDLDGTPAALVVSYSSVQMNQGATLDVTAGVVDARSTPLAIPVTITACATSITVTAANPAPTPPTSAHVVVRGVAPAATCFDVAGGGFTRNVPVVVLPTVFGGTLSSLAPRGGDTLTINSTTVLKFDTALATVTFPGGAAPVMVSKTPDQLRVLVPFSAAGPINIAGVNVTYVAGLRVTLPTPTVTQTGDLWGTGDVAYATAPVIGTPAAAASSVQMITNFGAANGANCAEFGPAYPNGSITPGNCVIYQFTLAAPTQLRFSTNWNSTSDIDSYVCDNTGLAGCFESGGSGAGSSQPENINAFTYAAGTHYFVIELFGPPGTTVPTNMYVTITRP